MGSFFDDSRAGTTIPAAVPLDAGVLDAITALVDVQALVSIGKTRDGGAVSITVTFDGRWRREYFRDPNDAFAFCSEALKALTPGDPGAGTRATLPPPTGPRRGPQRRGGGGKT